MAKDDPRTSAAPKAAQQKLPTAAEQEQQQKLYPPVLPLVWLLTPLLAAIIYGLMTR